MSEDFLPPEVTEDAEPPKKVDRRSKAFRDMIARKKLEEAEAPPVEAVEEALTYAPMPVFAGRSSVVDAPPPPPEKVVSEQTRLEQEEGRRNLRRLQAL